jgi:pimeloyl-ACP methyl ester carboxylesterase
MHHVTLLLGGLWGPDGWVDSRGMLALRDRLPECQFDVFQWNDWVRAARELNDDAIIIGYSGGGSRATWLAEETRKTIALMVLYDPSPRWQLKRIGTNVEKTICYWNTHPEMGGLGGGKATGHNVSIYEYSEQHLAVQYDEHLHALTTEYIRRVL